MEVDRCLVVALGSARASNAGNQASRMHLHVPASYEQNCTGFKPNALHIHALAVFACSTDEPLPERVPELLAALQIGSKTQANIAITAAEMRDICIPTAYSGC